LRAKTVVIRSQCRILHTGIPEQAVQKNEHTVTMIAGNAEVDCTKFLCSCLVPVDDAGSMPNVSCSHLRAMRRWRVPIWNISCQALPAEAGLAKTESHSASSYHRQC